MDRERLAELEKIAPVQGYSAGIPWSMHLRAYDAYCKRYRSQQALIEGGCRGGFSTGELDMFIPGWREELSETTKLRSDLTAMREEIERLRGALAEAECIPTLLGEIAELEQYGSDVDAKALRGHRKDLARTLKMMRQALGTSHGS